MNSKTGEIILAVVISAILGVSVIAGLGKLIPNNNHNQTSETEVPGSEPVITNPDQEESVTNPEQGESIIVPGEYDKRVIPDKYNTGCSGELYKINGENEINDIVIAYSGGFLVFDFFYRNKDVSDTIVFEDIDFSNYPVAVYHETMITGKKIKFVFKNCKFNDFKTGRQASDVFTYDFYNCSFKNFYGSNSSFHNCWFGGSFQDGMIPFKNIIVEDSYFSDFASNDPSGDGLHADGTQMYGHADATVENVVYSNCRFEVPAVHTTKSTSAVNACIMLALEYNNGKNIHFKDCILNGGGYTVYAGKVKGFTLEDTSFENIRIGDAKLYGNLYNIDKDVEYTDFKDQDALYVSSVWNDGSKTHVIVSNDTAEERILRVVTGTITQDFTIEKCLGGDLLRNGYYDMPFEDFPFDIDISVDSKADYVICFDVTEGYEKQIRYVSFDGQPTYYTLKEPEIQPEITEPTPTEQVEEDYSDMAPIQGNCGKNITYYLDNSGILRIEGTGEMYNYHSGNPAPWMEYSKLIVSIDISEGVTEIGAQAFRNLKQVEKVELPQSLTKIRGNAFIACVELKSLIMYSGVTAIDQYAFHGTNLKECDFYGSEDEWNAIAIDEHNDALISCNKRYLGNR